MEKIYTFDINPENYQPSGQCDFSKIYYSDNAILTYTNVNTLEKEKHIVKKNEIINNDGIKVFAYIFPTPFVKKDNI